MRIQRFIAKDMRTALSQVRDALGTEAVILSSGKVGNDVEVVAAMDMEVTRAVANAAPAAPQPVVHTALEFASRGRPDNIEARAAAAAAATEGARSRRASSQLSEEIAPVVVPTPPPLIATSTAAATMAGTETQGALAEMKD